jgi:glycosyltransferase involved in cell wall biosynthesis
MKILLVNYEYKGQGGGAGQQMFYLAQALRDFGHDVSLLIGWDDRLGSPELLNGVETHIVKHKRKNIQLSTPLGMLFFVMRGLHCIKRLTKMHTYDIIQFYFSVPTGILKYGIKGKIPYVVSLRGMDIPGLQKDRNKGLSMITSGFNKYITNRAAAVVTISSEASKKYNAFATNLSITVIPNAVDSESISAKEFYTDKVEKIISIGRLVNFKRFDLLVDSIVNLRNKYKNITLDIYGQGYLYDQLKRRIVENNAEAFVTIKGYMDRETLIGKLCDYDLFSLMSTGDSFGNVFTEAMASGLPVLAARTGGPLDIVIEGTTGVLSIPNDLDDIIKQLEYCINHPNKMKEFGINGRKRVEEYYSINAAAKQHIELYESILSISVRR